MKKTHKISLCLSAATLVLAGCAATLGSADIDKLTADIVKASFRDEGPVKIDRLVQDEAQSACSAADVAGKPLDEKTAKAIEAANLKTIKWPSGIK